MSIRMIICNFLNVRGKLGISELRARRYMSEECVLTPYYTKCNVALCEPVSRKKCMGNGIRGGEGEGERQDERGREGEDT